MSSKIYSHQLSCESDVEEEKLTRWGVFYFQLSKRFLATDTVTNFTLSRFQVYRISIKKKLKNQRDNSIITIIFVELSTGSGHWLLDKVDNSGDAKFCAYGKQQMQALNACKRTLTAVLSRRDRRLTATASLAEKLNGKLLEKHWSIYGK